MIGLFYTFSKLAQYGTRGRDVKGVVLILSSFMLQTGKADEVQVKSDEAKIDYVNSEASAP